MKDQLATAQSQGRLRYINGQSKAKAGYYSMETDPDVLRRTGINTAVENRERAEGHAAKAQREAGAGPMPSDS